MADRVYVPGYGYVTQGSTGTSGGVTGGSKPRDTGQRPTGRPPAARPAPAPTPTVSTAPDGSQRGVAAQAQSGTPGAVAGNNLTNPTLPVAPPKPPTYLMYGVGYRPPVWGTADRMEREIPGLPLIYRAQTSGDLREAYWGDPESRAIIQAAAREYYKDYPNYNDQWAEKFWQEDIINASLNPGSPPPWQVLQSIFAGEGKAASSPDGSSPAGYLPGGGSYGGGYGGGGSAGGGSVSLTDPTSARGLLLQTMQGVLGRNPTNREYKDFLDSLNASEMANPREVSVEGDVAVQSGGIDPGVLAVEFAQGAEDYKATQANKFYNAFMGALGGGLGG